VGPPGAGKSVLVEAIAEALGAPMHRLQVEIANHASALIGTETHWSSAAPGQLYDLLVEGDYINPIVMLDELEKVQTRSDHPNLHKVLFALLERASAKQFKDACVPQVPLDASWVRWVATANSLDGIPEPILTRMRIIEMPALTAEQACVVARNIDAEIRAQHRLMGLPALPQEAIELLARHSPRRMGQLIAETYGRLLADNRQSLSKADLHALEVAQHKPVSKSNFLSQLLDLTTVAAIRAVELNAQLPRMMVVTGSAPTFH
jgi:ATP-dependent Lon protease